MIPLIRSWGTSSLRTLPITNHNGARTLICKLDRDEMLQALVKSYLDL